RRVAGMPIGMGRAGGAPGTAARAGTAATGTNRPRTTGLAAARLARAARTRIAVARRTGIHAVGHVPAAECGRVALGEGALVLALLERGMRLARRGLAGH